MWHLNYKLVQHETKLTEMMFFHLNPTPIKLSQVQNKQTLPVDPFNKSDRSCWPSSLFNKVRFTRPPEVPFSDMAGMVMTHELLFWIRRGSRKEVSFIISSITGIYTKESSYEAIPETNNKNIKAITLYIIEYKTMDEDIVLFRIMGHCFTKVLQNRASLLLFLFNDSQAQ